MSKKKAKNVPRNSSVMSARSRVAGMAPMKSRNAPRGGQKNEQRELLEEIEDDQIDYDYELEFCKCDLCYDGFPYAIVGEVESVRFIDPYHIVWVNRDDNRYTIVFKPDATNSEPLIELMELEGFRFGDSAAKEQIEKLLILL